MAHPLALKEATKSRTHATALPVRGAFPDPGNDGGEQLCESDDDVKRKAELKAVQDAAWKEVERLADYIYGDLSQARRDELEAELSRSARLRHVQDGLEQLRMMLTEDSKTELLDKAAQQLF